MGVFREIREFREFKEYRERAHSSNLPEPPLISLISLISLITLIFHHDYHHDPISCQSGVVVVHHKRDHPGIVQSSTALGGLLLGMCR